MGIAVTILAAIIILPAMWLLLLRANLSYDNYRERARRRHRL